MNKMTMNGDIRLQYIYEPFKEKVNGPSFYTSTGVMKVILGHMGQGKTYQSQNHLIPYLIREKGVKLVINTVPRTEIVDKKAWSRCGINSGAHIINCINDKFKPEDIKNYLKDGDPVIAVMTTAKLINGFGKKVIDACREYGVLSAIFCDECHTQFTSESENAKDNMGWPYGENFEAVIYNTVSKISQYTPYVFGLTATVNAEQRGDIRVSREMKFEIINELPPSDLLIDNQCWLRDNYLYNIYDPYGNFNRDIYENNAFSEFGRQIQSMVNGNNKLNTKRTMMSTVPNDNSKNHTVMSDVVNFIRNLNVKHNHWNDDEFVFASMTCDSNKIYSCNGNFLNSTDEEIKGRLEDPEDPLCILLVKQKGNMGISIDNLCYLHCFRVQNKSDSNKDAIIEFAVQLLGRLVRPFFGISREELESEYNGDVKQYISTLKDKEIQELLSLNSFQYSVPNTNMWKNADYEFNRNRCSTVSQAETWITNNVK